MGHRPWMPSSDPVCSCLCLLSCIFLLSLVNMHSYCRYYNLFNCQKKGAVAYTPTTLCAAAATRSTHCMALCCWTKLYTMCIRISYVNACVAFL